MSFSISSLESSPALHSKHYQIYIIPLVNIDFSLLANSSGKTTTNTLDGGKGIHDLLLTVNVGVENTENVLEFTLVNKRLRRCQI